MRDVTNSVISKKLQEHTGKRTGTISALQLSQRNKQRGSEIFKIVFKAVFEELVFYKLKFLQEARIPDIFVHIRKTIKKYHNKKLVLGFFVLFDE